MNAASPPPSLSGKYDRLKQIIRRMKRAAIAFSGGVDSSLLLKAAAETLPERDVLAVTVSADIHPEWELIEATSLAADLKVRHQVVQDIGSGDPEFAANPPDRCYICKKRVFQRLREMADREGFPFVLDGENADDLNDYRPGSRAARELNVRSPLREAGLSKPEIRALSRHMGLPTWNKPAYACLASRFPYGTRITRETLARIDRAEQALRSLGFHEVRLRHHGSLARIEVAEAEIVNCARPDMRQQLVSALRTEGWLYITLDLQGYRMGSLNKELEPDDPETGST